MIIRQNIIEPKKTNNISETIEQQGAKLVRLGIQGIPGTKFYLNDLTDEIITVGFTGIYEINFKDLNIDIISITVMKNSNDIIVDTIWEN